MESVTMSNETTTSEVIDVFTSIASVEAEESDLAGGVRVVVPDEDVGRAFGLLRREGLDYESKRDPSGNLVINIPAEEGRSLGDLFR